MVFTRPAGRESRVRCTVPLCKSKGDARRRARGEGYGRLPEGRSERTARALSDRVVNTGPWYASHGCQQGISCRASAMFSHGRGLSGQGSSWDMRGITLRQLSRLMSGVGGSGPDSWFRLRAVS
jgi:hypothetical protein